ncbi:hypothetical protein V7183_15635, partial [Bacillus sp. JJ1127]|uniref:hypothetical protein n=1 Tax=Bacillus sp. JJ1127 TaxID=3122952 RepID=UPI002FFF5432
LKIRTKNIPLYKGIKRCNFFINGITFFKTVRLYFKTTVGEKIHKTPNHGLFLSGHDSGYSLIIKEIVSFLLIFFVIYMPEITSDVTI